MEALEEKLGYKFRRRELLARALTHRSRISERNSAPETTDNEQFEFLGDSILGFVASEALVAQHPSVREGQLSKWKAHLVSSTHLHKCALALGLGDYLLLGRGEERNGGRQRRTLLANALEAVIAAIHLDGGIDAARKFIEEHILGVLANPENVESIGSFNHKSGLQELATALGLPPPRYVTVETSGPEHAKIFTVEVRIGSRVGRAQGSSKKDASQHAAQALIAQLNDAMQAEGSAKTSAPAAND